MATYLCVKMGNNQTKSYSVKSSANKPYMRVSTGYLPLTTQTATDTGLRAKSGSNVYRIVESYTTTQTVETTRSSQYDTSSTNTYTYNTSRSSQYDTSRSSQYNTSSTNTYTYQETNTENSISTFFQTSEKFATLSVKVSQSQYGTKWFWTENVSAADKNASASVYFAMSTYIVWSSSSSKFANFTNTSLSYRASLSRSKTGTLSWQVKIQAPYSSSLHNQGNLTVTINSTHVIGYIQETHHISEPQNHTYNFSTSTAGSLANIVYTTNTLESITRVFSTIYYSYMTHTYTKNDKTSTNNYSTTRSSGYTSSRQSDYTTNDKTSTSNYTSSRSSTYTSEQTITVDG